MVVPLEEMRSIIGHRFPGGTFHIEHWENFLMHDVMLVEQSPDKIAHPLYFFHLPIAGLGVTIQDIFALCRADSPDAVRAGEYVWEIERPLREDRTYRVSGEITDVVRKEGRRGGVMDLVTFVTEISDVTDGEPKGPDARISNMWIFLRSAA